MLVDQDRCRGWRQCITGCPYKKIYFNHKTGKAEKCTFCYPRVEVGLPDRVLGDLRRPAALPRPVPVRRRPGHRGRLDPGREGPLRGPAGRDPRPERPGGHRERPWQGHPGRLAGRRPALAGLRAGQEVQGGAAAASGVPDDADGLVHPAAVPGRRPAPGPGPRRGGRAASCSGPSTRCGSRWSTWPSCSPPATPPRSSGCSRKLAAMRSYMRDITLGRPGRRVDRRRGRA